MKPTLRLVSPKRAAVWCSFCGRSEVEADHMLTGAARVAICDTCVRECVAEIARMQAKKSPSASRG